MMSLFKMGTPPACPERRTQTNKFPDSPQQSLLFNLKLTLASKHLKGAAPCSLLFCWKGRRDLELSAGIHNVSFLSLFVLSFAPRGLRFTCARQQRHATLNLRSLPERLLALSPDSANDRCYLHHRKPAAVRGNQSPKPRWLFRIADLARQISAPSRGLDSLCSLHLSHSKACLGYFISSLIPLLRTVSLPSPDTEKHSGFPYLYTPHCEQHPLFLFPSNPFARRGLSSNWQTREIIRCVTCNHIAPKAGLSFPLLPFIVVTVILALLLSLRSARTPLSLRIHASGLHRNWCTQVGSDGCKSNIFSLAYLHK